MSLPSRSLRHSNRKKSRLGRLVTLGGILFGSIFIVFIVYELFLAQKGSTDSDLRLNQSKSSTVVESTTEKADSSPPEKTVSVAAPVVQTKAVPKPESQSAASPHVEPIQSDSAAVPPTPKTPAKASTPAPAAKQAGSSKQQITAPKEITPVKSNAVKSNEVKKKPQATKHIVQKGETLFQLSRKYYGNQSSVKKIAAFNGIAPDTALLEGKVLFIPKDN